MRDLFNKGDPDEPRDLNGRWAQAGRDALRSKARRALTSAKDKIPTAAAMAAKVGAIATSSIGGIPDAEGQQFQHHAAVAAGHIAGRVVNHPAWRRLATAVVRGFKKSQEAGEANRLKSIVAEVAAETPLPPQVTQDDEVFSKAVRGAYKHCHDRLQAMRMAATS